MSADWNAAIDKAVAVAGKMIEDAKDPWYSDIAWQCVAAIEALKLEAAPAGPLDLETNYKRLGLIRAQCPRCVMEIFLEIPRHKISGSGD